MFITVVMVVRLRVYDGRRERERESQMTKDFSSLWCCCCCCCSHCRHNHHHDNPIRGGGDGDGINTNIHTFFLLCPMFLIQQRWKKSRPLIIVASESRNASCGLDRHKNDAKRRHHTIEDFYIEIQTIDIAVVFFLIPSDINNCAHLFFHKSICVRRCQSPYRPSINL